MDKTRDSTNSKIWPDSTCAISVRRKGQILLVVESLVLSTTLVACNSLEFCMKAIFEWFTPDTVFLDLETKASVKINAQSLM